MWLKKEKIIVPPAISFVLLVKLLKATKKENELEERRRINMKISLDSNDVELVYTTAQRRFIGNVRMKKGFLMVIIKI